MSDRPETCGCGCNGDSLALEDVARTWLHNAIAAFHCAEEPDCHDANGWEVTEAMAAACAHIADAAITIGAAAHMRDVIREAGK